MALAQKPRISRFTKTLLDLGWYMSLTICVVYVGMLVLSLFIPDFTIFLNSVYMHSGLRVNLSLDDLQCGIYIEQGAHDIRLVNATVIPMWIRPGGATLWLGVLASGVKMAVALFVLFKLRRFVQTIIDGTPFQRENRNRVLWVGGALIVGFVSIMTIALIHGQVFLGGSGADELGLGTGDYSQTASVWMFIAGLLCIVIADAFRYGTDLQIEQDLTV